MSKLSRTPADRESRGVDLSIRRICPKKHYCYGFLLARITIESIYHFMKQSC